ncbi:D-hexose-6-phosphate mutarotase [Pragia fontium]|uniref:Putative glucose-6-phosphate 1-epimerase n=2 Tax=Pragia fontium TaxID=82985 RepID=A0AAJ4WC15_9GAMM|nr:D-hexose-6-phosphate mutarotase [Pragia fontium]GKX62573.1 D-hexose-6-phosphate mutarotase [Pragia fontium]SFD12821.1 glucose-6-phosphate 1-epimerase [Pragia fontium DSM 5563 = ATCC 49100]VEJ55824.1 Putative glucose-6-phosphate 1-epimerase [Pragia fontium]
MSDSLFSLPIEQQLTPSLTLRKKDDLSIIVINHPKATAAIALQGAHLLSWQPKGEMPVIWLSQSSQFKTGAAIRGGVPICWPWFGKAGTPSHGFARNELWQLTEHSENEDGVWLTFSLEDNPHTRQIWPYAFRLIARIKINTTCEIELESHGDYPVTCALHTYLNIADISQVNVSGLGGHYMDKVIGGEHDSTEKALTFNGPIDRIYTQPESVSLIQDPVAGRSIEIHHRNATDVVTWNPGAEGASGMSDMENDGYKTMVCVETASVSNPVDVRNDRPQRLSSIILCRRN